MQKSAKIFGGMFAGFSVLAVVCAAFAAEPTPRAAADVREVNRATVAPGRMPSMPILTINPANLTTDTKPSQPDVDPKPQPKPDPKPEPEPEPEPQPECPDGGVRNSEYTVNNCMNDVLACINNGALSGGLNDLFNEDMRNSIMNGMGLCSIQVEKCMMEVRRDCKPVYRAIADVWVDFNSRKVQPEYYNFVLRRTGLTPNQAENTCLLLDVNTYGSSFNAVANSGLTTAEYNNRVGAYNNQQGGVLIKTNPQGAELNYGNPGVDGSRGHYARWDATTATCYLRVAAYNKDQQIKNSWLFGALGNDDPAQVWRAAGDTFSCNKDLFGFSLLNDTKTTAVVGVGGGTLAGAGIGALAGHGKRAFDCDNRSAVRTLGKELWKNTTKITKLNRMLEGERITSEDLSVAQCEEINEIYNEYLIGEGCRSKVRCIAETKQESGCPQNKSQFDAYVDDHCGGKNLTATECEEYIVAHIADCLTNGVACSKKSELCEIPEDELKDMEYVFDGIEVLKGEKSNYGTTIPVGAAIGAGTGGLATAITAFVERNNINCRVGDGLNTVAFGKSHTINTLKDFYVKWNLHLPDTVIPTATAVDCKTWKLSCAEYTDLNQCKNAALNYKPTLDGTITLIRSACKVSGSVCIENAAVAKSYGACE